jgi:hypothetical protein
MKEDMKRSTALLFTLVFVSANSQVFAQEIPEKPTAEPDSLVYAAGHGVGTILYDATTGIAQALTLVLPLLLKDPQQEFTRSQLCAYGAVNGALFAARIWGKFKLPEWIDHYVFDVHIERSKTHKILSCAGRFLLGWPAACLVSLTEIEYKKRNKKLTSAQI